MEHTGPTPESPKSEDVREAITAIEKYFRMREFPSQFGQSQESRDEEAGKYFSEHVRARFTQDAIFLALFIIDPPEEM